MLLPGITTLTRLVARLRDEATQRLWDTLSELMTALGEAINTYGRIFKSLRS